MKNRLYFLFLMFLSFSVNALEVQFKLLSLNVPDNELKNILVADSDLLIMATNWEMYFSDTNFSRDCERRKKKIPQFNLDCSEKNRINLLSDVMKSDKLKELFFLTASYHYPLGIQYKSFARYEMYYVISGKSNTADSMIFLINKRTGKTIQINGKFEEKHLNMFVLNKN